MTKPDSGTWLFLLVSAMLAGVLIAAQSGINAQLGKRVGHPLMGAFISFLIGTFLIALLVLCYRLPWPDLRQIARESPWWIWLGGFMGAFFVTSTIVLAPKLGAANLICAVIAGQMLISLLIDQYGLIGFPKVPVSASRIGGAILLILGVLLIQRK